MPYLGLGHVLLIVELIACLSIMKGNVKEERGGEGDGGICINPLYGQVLK